MRNRCKFRVRRMLMCCLDSTMQLPSLNVGMTHSVQFFIHWGIPSQKVLGIRTAHGIAMMLMTHLVHCGQVRVAKPIYLRVI
mmetsp:Transcript_141920/g.257923  ORF Transcript_141920/g.257923 Transcript_141920/m.257923 type:complete len:82 (+) Transcript_141920:890-1135(+)